MGGCPNTTDLGGGPKYHIESGEWSGGWGADTIEKVEDIYSDIFSWMLVEY